MAQQPSFEEMTRMRVVYSVPGMDEVVVRRDVVYKAAGETRLEMDAYSPPGLSEGSRLPAVVFVHGGPVAPQMKPKNMGIFASYGELVAASGFVAVTFNHRFYGGEQLSEAESDISDLIGHVRRNAESLRVDPERLAIWAFSGGGPFLSLFLRDRPSFVRCLVSYYAALDLQVPPPGQPDTLGPETRRRFSPLAHLAQSQRPIPPILVARAGGDHPFLNQTVDRFVQEALARNAPLDLMNHPVGRHGFDILDDDARSREILRRTLEFLKAHLLG